jgi:O-antigen ligase
LAAVIILVLIALPNARGSREGRLRLVGVLVLAAVLIVPFLGGTRFVGAQGGNASANKHISDFESSISLIETNPLGLGLGSVPSIVNRFDVRGFFIGGEDVSQNLVIQVGYELGVPALVPWLMFMALVLMDLRRRAKRGDPFALAMAFALLGIIVAGLFHHVFVQFPVPWTLWAGAGLALSVHQGDDAKVRTLGTNSYPMTVGVP